MNTMQFLKLKTLFFSSLLPLLIFWPFYPSTSYAQSSFSGGHYIENVQTGLLMDIKGNLKEKGTSVWSYSLNYSDAQIFYISTADTPDRFGTDAHRIIAINSDLFLSAKVPSPEFERPPPSNLGDHEGVFDPTQPTRGTEPQVVDGGISGSDRTQTILSNYVFTIEEKEEYEDTPGILDRVRFDLESRQIWKLLPVPNEPNTYFIQNALFSEKMVVEPLTLDTGGKLGISSFTGSDLQKWKILPTQPNDPTDLELSDVESYRHGWFWLKKSIRGRLTWKKNNSSSDLIKQQISISQGGSSSEITVRGDVSSYKFNVGSKNTNYCFNVTAFSKWSSESSNRSRSICENLDNDQPTPSDEEVTTSISMVRQEIIEGFIPYLGTFGPITSGVTIKNINFPTQRPPVYLVKPGFSTGDCGNSNAVILVHGDMTSAQKIEVFGADEINLTGTQRLTLIGCASATSSSNPSNWLPVNITWVRN